ncbi:outer membrane protein assembly factor BamA [Litorisediminicola beolgyonensis]|uniref:Outer membrane protein assembly factor BamA n=1 Tax=Litorisediminicola beolgyonensis TaxID=1173614 RepID=A0ABW3ZGI8_9RHOB
MSDSIFGGRSGLGRASRSATALALILALAATTLPNGVVAQSYSFSNVSIEGNQRVEPGTILSYAGIARGQTVSAGELNSAYQRIQESGLFESVEIVPQGNTLVIRVVEYPTINTIAVEGNSRISDEDLQPVIQSQSRRVFSPTQAEADANAIAEAYVAQGRISARVQPRVIRRSDNRVDLVFEVFEGGVVEVERIAFNGNRAFSDRRLRRAIETRQAGLLRAFVTRDSLVEDRLQFDQQLLRDFYASRGFVDFRVLGVNAELTEERDAFFVTFNIEEGQQFKVGNVSVVSDMPGVDPDAFQRAIKMRSGQVYSPSAVETDIARLERMAIREGLDFVRVEPRIDRNDRDVTLDVTYQLTRGPRIFVERIDIEGNTTTLDRVVRRQFDTVEGDPFNPREIRAAAERIRALGFFSDAEVDAREGSTPQQVVVDVDVTEQPTGSISFGGNYSTNSGFGAAISFSERNFLGRGQQLSLGVNTASDNSRYFFRFTEPALLGRDVAFGLNLSYYESEQDNARYNTKVGTLSPSLTFPLNDSSRLQLRYTLQSTDLSIPDGSIDETGELVKAEAERGKLIESSIGYTFSYDTRRTGLDPDAGVLLEFGQDFGGLGGDTEFVKTTARAVAQRLAFNEDVTLRATVEAGAVNYSGDGSRVTDRFFLGSSLMRGFEPGGIGPREYNDAADVDDALGGNYFAVARLEAEFPLGFAEEYGIRGGLFYDVGNLWGLDKTNSDVLYEDGAWRQVVGAALLWDTPLGPLRFNFTETLQKEDRDKDQNFELTIQTDF